MTILAAIAFPPLDPIALRVGPLAIRWYGLAYVAGFVAAGFVLRFLARRWRLGLTDDDVVTIVLAAVIGILLGGRLGYVVFYGGGAYLRDPLSILRVWDGGMSFHGGLTGAILASVFISWRLRMPWLTLCDLGVVGTPVGLFFGRLANFVNGELWGRVSDVPWAIVFPGGGPVGRHPSQLYEAVVEGAAIFAVLALLAVREPARPRGELFGWFLALYGAARIVVEFFREPDVQIGFLFGGVTMGQVLSVPVLILGVVLVWWARRRSLPEGGPKRAEGSAGVGGVRGV